MFRLALCSPSPRLSVSRVSQDSALLLSLGQVLKAMILNGLGFLSAPCPCQWQMAMKPMGLLVYTLAQRKLRQALRQAETGIPNQLGKLTDKPTMRWDFQCFQSIHLVRIAGQKPISNLTSQRCKILRFLRACCGRYYLLE